MRSFLLVLASSLASRRFFSGFLSFATASLLGIYGLARAFSLIVMDCQVSCWLFPGWYFVDASENGSPALPCHYLHASVPLRLSISTFLHTSGAPFLRSRYVRQSISQQPCFKDTDLLWVRHAQSYPFARLEDFGMSM